MHPVHRFELAVSGDSLVLDRVTGVCRARSCRIVALEYHAGDRHRGAWMSICVAVPTGRARLVRERLRALPDVLELTEDERVDGRRVRAAGDRLALA